MTIEVKNDEMLGRTNNTTLHIELMKLQQERDRYKQMYEMEKTLFVDADLKIERAIEYIQENCYINEEDKTKVCSYGDDLNPSYLLEILKGDKE